MMDKQEEDDKIENYLQSLLDEISLTDEQARVIFGECVACNGIADWTIYIEHETMQLCFKCHDALRPLLDWKTSAQTEIRILRKAAGENGRKLVKYCRHLLKLLGKWEYETCELEQDIDDLVTLIVEKIGWRFFF